MFKKEQDIMIDELSNSKKPENIIKHNNLSKPPNKFIVDILLKLYLEKCN